MRGSPRLDDQLCFALYAASRAMVAAYQPFLAPLGLTYPQYLVLLCLWEEDHVTVSHLGERLHLDSGTLTPLLKRMEKDGLVTRARDREDERKVILTLGPRGRKLEARAPEVTNGIFCSFGASLEEIVRVRTSVKRLISKLESKKPVSKKTPSKKSEPNLKPNPKEPRS